MSHKSTVRVSHPRREWESTLPRLSLHSVASVDPTRWLETRNDRDDANKMLFHLNAVRTIPRSRRICPLGQAKLAKEETTARRVDQLFKEFADLGLAQTTRSRC
jgi:hypothetical protein